MTSFTSDFFKVCLLCMIRLFSKTMLEVITIGLQWSRMAETDEQYFCSFHGLDSTYRVPLLESKLVRLHYAWYYHI